MNDKSDAYESTGHDEALTNYMAMTDSNNIEEAIQLLEESQWDVTVLYIHLTRRQQSMPSWTNRNVPQLQQRSISRLHNQCSTKPS